MINFLIFSPGLSLTNIVLSPAKDGFSLSATIDDNDRIETLRTDSIQFDKKNIWLAESITIGRSLCDIVIQYEPIKTSPEELEPKK